MTAPADVAAALVLGVLQGLTEFFPVSSSAHLEVVPWLAGWDLFDGDNELENAFDVALHVGTLVGAAWYLRADIARYATALWTAARTRRLHLGDADPDRGAGGESVAAAALARSDRGDARLDGPERHGREAVVALSLLVSAVPAAIVGVSLESRLLGLAEEPLLIAALLACFGWLLWWSDALATRRGAQRLQQSYGLRDALGMGLAQAAALLPGVSRSGVTMTAGRWLGFDRVAAARLACLMSLPLIGGAGVYRFATLADAVPTGAQLQLFIVGGIAAALSSWAGVAAMVWLLDRTGRQPKRNPFALFAGYRLALAAAVAVVALSGLR